jgi:uncharacterized membrane protein
VKRWRTSYLFTGSALYVVGVIGLTIAYHVPRNEALAAALTVARGLQRVAREALGRQETGV